MSKSEGSAEYSIAAVSKLTGVSCHALRVWERRYGFPVPHRSASGHRRYSREQVGILKRIAELIQQGQAIGELIADVREGRLGPGPDPSPDAPSGVGDGVAELIDRLIAADVAGAQACYDRLAGLHDAAELVVRVLEPALVDIGERWFRRECDVFQEHTASGFVRRKLEVLIEAAVRANAEPSRRIVAGTVQGDRHSGGALILHLVLERVGWRVLNLGVDLPVREYQKAVSVWRPDALALSFVLSRNINKRFQELSQIRKVPVFVGGRSILNYQGLARRHGLIPVPGPISASVGQLLDEFDQWMRARGAQEGS